MNRSYVFDGSITREVLESYLSRSISMDMLLSSDTFEDDLRMLKNIGAKFLGRLAGTWGAPSDPDGHFSRAAAVARRLHAQDPEMILQAAVFETTNRAVEKIIIPDFVCTEFGIKNPDRPFSYEHMLFENGHHIDQWRHDFSVPDITRPETQMFFFYLSARYIDAGYESIHFGQVHLYASNDTGYLQTRSLLNRIRAYALRAARRHLLIADTHTHGIVVNGRLLFDMHTRVLFLRAIAGQPRKVNIIRQGLSRGGIAPSGYVCEHLPTLLEFDLYGGSIEAAPESIRIRKPDGSLYHAGEYVPGVLWPWGYDEIAWLAHEDEQARNGALTYAHEWIRKNLPGTHLKMPGSKHLCVAPVMCRRDDGTIAPVPIYKANTKSAFCPDGFNQEETIKQVWQHDSGCIYQPAASAIVSCQNKPEELADPVTGFSYPDTVVLCGEIQAAIGGEAWNPDSPTGMMTCIGNGIYRFECVFPKPVTVHLRVCVGGSWTENYGQEGVADGKNFVLSIPRAGCAAVFVFDYNKKQLRVELS